MVERLKTLFSLAPIFYGFIAMIISGSTFPLCGVMVLRLNLFTMRYMLMHGVILGGAISLAFSIPVVPVSFVINLLLILIMIFFAKGNTFGFSGGIAAAMILSMAFSSFLMHVMNVPAKDTLSILWGSPFALKKIDNLILLIIGVGLVFYVVLNFKNIITLFYNIDIARSLGINVTAHYIGMVSLIAIVIAVAMKLLGAFLIDSLLILPVLSSSMCDIKKSGGIKKLFILSSVFGFGFAVVGYVIAVLFDFPPAATISILSGVVYMVLAINLFIQKRVCC